MLRKGPCAAEWTNVMHHIMENRLDDQTYYSAMGCYALLMKTEHTSSRVLFNSPLSSDDAFDKKPSLLSFITSLGESYIDSDLLIGYSMLPHMLRLCLTKDGRFQDRAEKFPSLLAYSKAVSQDFDSTIVGYLSQAINACFATQQNSEELYGCYALQFQKHAAIQLASTAFANCVHAHHSNETPLSDALLNCFEIANSFSS
eukprot:CAMPEP_0117422522 /NCGR_PEP_ID=MMETSP0758-20121206/3338_1 /TAXON_ID=63605 /ORGANISM="Percolomonas cosmopolitus, Strain AE-1 (ATCC 50343)" /LENGTH=200 /DNA_ID=CAMNT_0005205179 /DNA_START=44 /DNA_END=642 /DNA_ORIENTATION=-